MEMLANYGLTACFGLSNLTMGTTTTVTIGASPAPICIDGKAYALTAASNTAVTSVLDIGTGVVPKGIAAGYGAVVLVLATSAGTVATLRYMQSEIVPLTANASQYHPGSFLDNPEFPVPPAGYCCIGYFVVKVATDFTAGAVYTFGTTSVATGSMNSAATAYSVTVTNVATLPSRPQAS